MFTEILRIKPVLDNGTTASMERNLAARFGRVAKKFGQGLKGVVKGTVLGISLGLLNKLLNPLSALEEKVKKLLGEGSDLRDLADKFNTDPGKLKRLQDVAGIVGLKPEQFNEMIGKFAQTIEKAREEIKAHAFNPTSEISAGTKSVSQFLGEKDLAESFFSFIQSLKKANSNTRLSVEKEVFGERQYGAARRLIEADIPSVAAGLPSVQKNKRAIENLAKQSDLSNRLSTVNESRDFVKASGMTNADMIRAMEAREQKERDKETEQLKSFKDLEKAAKAIEDIKSLFQGLLIEINKGIGHLADLVGFISKLKMTSWFRGIGGGK